MIKINLKYRENELLKLGNVYSFKCDELDINNLFANQDINYRLVNFPVKESIKINPYFNSLKINIIEDIKSKIEKECEIDLRVESHLGMTLIIMIELLKYFDILILNTVGFSEQSVNFILNLFKTKSLNGDKIIIFVLNKEFVNLTI